MAKKVTEVKMSVEEIEVCIPRDLVNRICNMKDSINIEIGGYLIGFNDEHKVVIEDIIPIMGFGDDEGGTAEYTMNPKSQNEYASTDLFFRTVGTWHTHPSGSTASPADWETLAKYNEYEMLFVSLIVGSASSVASYVINNNAMYKATTYMTYVEDKDDMKYIEAMKARYKEVMAIDKLKKIKNRDKWNGYGNFGMFENYTEEELKLINR